MLCRVKAREWFEQAIAFMFPVLYFYVQSDSSDQTIIDQKKKYIRQWTTSLWPLIPFVILEIK